LARQRVWQQQQARDDELLLNNKLARRRGMGRAEIEGRAASRGLQVGKASRGRTKTGVASPTRRSAA
jgi:hypothetical protein